MKEKSYNITSFFYVLQAFCAISVFRRLFLPIDPKIVLSVCNSQCFEIFGSMHNTYNQCETEGTAKCATWKASTHKSQSSPLKIPTLIGSFRTLVVLIENFGFSSRTTRKLAIERRKFQGTFWKTFPKSKVRRFSNVEFWGIHGGLKTSPMILILGSTARGIRKFRETRGLVKHSIYDNFRK